MKRVSIATLMLLLVSCQTIAPSGSNALDGAWEIVSGKYVSPEGRVTEYAAPEIRSLKVLNDSRFAFVTVRADGTFIRGAGGRYTISGNKYSEHLDKASMDGMRGKTYTFEWRLDGDRWYHTGTNEGGRIEEVWRRAQ